MKISDLKNHCAHLFATDYRRSLIVMISLLVLSCLFIDLYLGLWSFYETSISIFYSDVLFGTISICVLFVYGMCMTRWRDFFYQGVRNWDFYDIAVSIVYVFLVLNIFSGLKSLIPFMNWYWMDDVLIDVERFVHFGFLPTDLFYQYGRPMWLFDLSLYFYFSWFFLFYFFIVYAIFGFGHRGASRRFLVSFGLSWLLIGVVLATLCASAGPVFMQDIHGDTRFAEYEAWFMAHAGYLAQLKTFCADMVHNMPMVDYNAVSAMPSMHVSIAALMVFFIWDYLPGWRIVAVLYLVGIQVACVILLMHYAIDGYVAMLATWLIWRWAGRYDLAKDNVTEHLDIQADNQ